MECYGKEYATPRWKYKDDLQSGKAKLLEIRDNGVLEKHFDDFQSTALRSIINALLDYVNEVSHEQRANAKERSQGNVEEAG